MMGCSHERISYQYVYPQVPQAMLQSTAFPSFSGQTNGELYFYALDLREALGQCNADKAAITAIIGGKAGNGTGR